MTDWIALANARFAENGVTPAAETDENGILTVSAAPEAQGEHTALGGFGSFGSSTGLPFEKNSTTFLPRELLPTPFAAISESQKAASMALQAANTGPDQPTTAAPGSIAEHDIDPVVMTLLARFELDKLPAEIQDHVEAGFAADEVRRTINIAFHLITVKNFGFDRALQAAAQWVVENREHPDEAGFVDVMRLYHSVPQGSTGPAEFAGDGDDFVDF